MKYILSVYLRPYYGRMSLGFVIKFIGTIMDLFIPYILANIIDNIIPTGSRKLIVWWGFLMIFCSGLAVLFNIIANRMASKVARNTTEKLRHDLFSKVMYLSNRQMDELTKPSVISRMTSDTYNVHQAVGQMQRLGVRAPILLIGGILVTLTLDAALACVLLAVLPVLGVIITLISRKSIPLFTGLQEATDRFVRLVREDISGIRVIKALSKKEFEKEKFDSINSEVVSKEKTAGRLMAVMNPSMNFLLNIGFVMVLLTGAYRVNAGTSEVGKILAFMTYFTLILNALMMVSRLLSAFSKAVASADRISQVLLFGEDMKAEPVGEAKTTAQKCESAHNFIVFDKVTFSYYGNRANLKEISFALKEGETLGIIGATGSGKSTLAKLLMRFYDVDEGAIYLGGENIKTIEPERLYHQFGVVFQNDTIFEESIIENVRLGRELGSDQIWNALTYARAREFVEEKSDQMGEKLTIKGANLSGGQKQRVLIARALAGKPKILILDDSSSALDYKTDAMLRKEIREHFKGTTTILIAQRVSSILQADHILVLDDGREIGFGKHEELLENCPEYAEIARTQMGQTEQAG